MTAKPAASKVAALREADHVAHTWSVGERVSVCIDAWQNPLKTDPELTTSVYFNDQSLVLSIAEHEELFDAYERIYDLLHGGWRDYFDDSPVLLAELDAEAIK